MSKPFIDGGSVGAKTMEEDQELKLIEQRKLAEMRRRVKPAPAPTPQKESKSARQSVEGMLYDRGDEVLEAAYSFYPEQTGRIVEELATMMKDGKLVDKISGGELYAVFRQLGVRFKMKTSIKVQDRGRLVDLSEKLMRREEG